MGRESPERRKQARLFVAVDLPERTREQLAAWQEANGVPELRAVPPGALHFTLAFIGSVEEGRIAEAEAALASVAPRPIAIELSPEPEPIPPRGRPRLYALGAESPDMSELEGEVSTALSAAALYEPESARRPFWPHLTVFRVRGKGGRPARVSSPPGALPDSVERAFGGVRLALYRSYLRPEGAEYVPIVDVELPPPGGPAEAQER